MEQHVDQTGIKCGVKRLPLHHILGDAAPNKKAKQSFSVTQNDIETQRRNLPIFKVRKMLLKKIRQSDSVVVLGETACGKTTQIPQYLYEVGEHREKIIGCTQPRRVAAITVAQRVSQEVGTQLGDIVGYCIRFDDTTSPKTRIKYMTDGMLLRESIGDPLLKRYSVVILDEAHERSIHTDVLFGIVKDAQKERRKRSLPPLKLSCITTHTVHKQPKYMVLISGDMNFEPWTYEICCGHITCELQPCLVVYVISLQVIIMSATMDVDHFSKYFNSAPVVYVEGRQYPVKLYYSPEPQSDFLFASLVTIFQLHQEEPPDGDILVFLTGQEEIEATVKAIKEISHSLPQDCPSILACPMYANMPAGQQLKIFRPTPEGCRKVIVATNIAETSVTINGIKFVVDSGMVKAKTYNAKTGSDLLKVQKISQNQAWQRTGRAGRESPGICYRLYTEEEFETWKINTVPEIQRCNLGSVVLQLMALGITDVYNFDFMDKPSVEHLNSAYEDLVLLGAVSEDKKNLTPLGRKMAEFPLDPKLSKVILSAKDHGCMEEILTVVALLSTENLLFNSPEKREEANAVRKKFMATEGDHITLLNIYRSYKAVNGNKKWCFDNFLNAKNMMQATDIRRQLADVARRMNLPFQSCGRDLTAVRKCLVSGFFMNSAELRSEGQYITHGTKKTVSIHPSSSLFMRNPAHIIYNELVQTTKCYMKDVFTWDPEWLNEVTPISMKDCLKKR